MNGAETFFLSTKQLKLEKEEPKMENKGPVEQIGDKKDTTIPQTVLDFASQFSDEGEYWKNFFAKQAPKKRTQPPPQRRPMYEPKQKN